MHTTGSLAEKFTSGGAAIVALGPGMNGSGGDNRVYGMGSDNVFYNIGRNTYRYPATWKIDLRLAKSIDLGGLRKLEVLAESFNLFNHQNVTELEMCIRDRSGRDRGCRRPRGAGAGGDELRAAAAQPLH